MAWAVALVFSLLRSPTHRSSYLSQLLCFLYVPTDVRNFQIVYPSGTPFKRLQTHTKMTKNRVAFLSLTQFEFRKRPIKLIRPLGSFFPGVGRTSWAELHALASRNLYDNAPTGPTAPKTLRRSLVCAYNRAVYSMPSQCRTKLVGQWASFAGKIHVRFLSTYDHAWLASRNWELLQHPL